MEWGRKYGRGKKLFLSHLSYGTRLGWNYIEQKINRLTVIRVKKWDKNLKSIVFRMRYIGKSWKAAVVELESMDLFVVVLMVNMRSSGHWNLFLVLLIASQLPLLLLQTSFPTLYQAKTTNTCCQLTSTTVSISSIFRKWLFAFVFWDILCNFYLFSCLFCLERMTQPLTHISWSWQFWPVVAGCS